MAAVLAVSVLLCLSSLASEPETRLFARATWGVSYSLPEGDPASEPWQNQRSMPTLMELSIRVSDFFFRKTAAPLMQPGEKSLLVLRSRNRTDVDNEGWTGLYAGYGQYFSRDNVPVTRSSGAGHIAPDWIYFKVGFRL